MEQINVWGQIFIRDNIVTMKDLTPHTDPTHTRCPKINGCIERYNRTLREEFLNYHINLIEDPEQLNLKLADYLIFHNTERPHKALGLKSPIDYLLSERALSNKSVTYTCS
jgi:putative transposase